MGVGVYNPAMALQERRCIPSLEGVLSTILHIEMFCSVVVAMLEISKTGQDLYCWPGRNREVEIKIKLRYYQI